MVAVITTARTSDTRTCAPVIIAVGRPVPRPALRVLPGGGGVEARAAVYRRRRLVALLVVVTIVVLGAMATRAGADVASRWAAPVPTALEGPTVELRAEPGDTLWTMARRVRPAGDVRPAVEAMLAERGTTEVQVGDRVRVPAG